MYDYIKMFMHYDLTLSPLALRINIDRGASNKIEISIVKRDRHRRATAAESVRITQIYNIIVRD